MLLFKTILHWAGIGYAVLAALIGISVIFDSNSQQEGMQTIALAVTSIACLQAA